MEEEQIRQIFLMFSKYFWVAAIVVTCLNAIIMSLFMQGAKAGERIKMMFNLGFWLNVPWIVMGFGCTLGGVPSLWHYLRPRDGEPFVLAWWASVLVLYVVSFYWMFIGGGAAKLANFGMIRYYGLGKSTAIRSEKVVKILFLLMLGGGLVGALVMWFGDISLPPFVE
jgi:hypothetical protein